jgi:glycerate kinase
MLNDIRREISELAVIVLTATERPLADGGEGTLDALGGANRTTLVTGPLGKPVQAPWRLHRGTAVIEMACASGLLLAGGREKNDPIAATTTGTGELIDAALDLGAKRIIVCLGGSATTDGGLGAVKAIQTPARLKGVEFVVACDVTTQFTDAAKVFGPQKGASPAQVQFLTTRLEKLVQVYQQNYGVDVSEISGAGAAGGLAGGLSALGAQLVPGFDLVAEEVELDVLLSDVDMVITGEGFMDSESFAGKVVGSMAELASERKIQIAAICGEIHPDVRSHINSVSLVETFGRDEAFARPLHCIEHAALKILRDLKL